MFSSSWAMQVGRYSTIGFIGLGNMGKPMAVNLARRNPVLGFDSNPKTRRAVEANPGELRVLKQMKQLREADVIITMLPTPDACLEVYCGDEGLARTARRGQLLVDCSTVDPTTSRTIADAAASRDAVFVDAPVSGGTPAAQAATLTFMAGGSLDDVTRAEEFLLQMGRRVIHTGPVGSGAVAKICNNLMASVNLAGTSEVVGLGTRLGLDPGLLVKIMNHGSGMNWATESYCPVEGVMDDVPAANDYEGGFASALMLKDLNLAQSLAEQAGVPLMSASVTQNLYRFICEQGHHRKDFGVVSTLFKAKNRSSSGHSGQQGNRT